MTRHLIVSSNLFGYSDCYSHTPPHFDRIYLPGNWQFCFFYHIMFWLVVETVYLCPWCHFFCLIPEMSVLSLAHTRAGSWYSSVDSVSRRSPKPQFIFDVFFKMNGHIQIEIDENVSHQIFSKEEKFSSVLILTISVSWCWNCTGALLVFCDLETGGLYLWMKRFDLSLCYSSTILLLILSIVISALSVHF